MQKILPLVFLLIAFFACKDEETPVIPPAAEPDLNEQSVYTIRQQPFTADERVRLGRNLGAADFEPLGLMVKPNETVTVSVSVTNGSGAPSLLMGTYSRNDWSYTPKEFGLTVSSPRTLTNPTSESQLLYIRYAGNNPDAVANVTVEGGWKVPFFVLGESENAEFREELREYENYVDVQLMSNRGIVVLSRNIALKYLQQDWSLLMQTLDQIVEAEEYISGQDGSAEVHSPIQNKYLLTQTRDTRYWMAATNYRTFYNATDAIDYVADQHKLEHEGWGPWHEIGHQHQLSAITWGETVEVTVNIYSLAVERGFGQVSRLKRENRWPGILAYLDKPEDQKNYNDPSVGFFMRLGLFQQLWLAYGDEFFIRLHKEIREEAPQFTLKEEKMGYLMRKASEVAGHDLSGFFRTWGFQLDPQYYDAVAALGLPVPETDPSKLSE